MCINRTGIGSPRARNTNRGGRRTFFEPRKICCNSLQLWPRMPGDGVRSCRFLCLYRRVVELGQAREIGPDTGPGFSATVLEESETGATAKRGGSGRNPGRSGDADVAANSGARPGAEGLRGATATVGGWRCDPFVYASSAASTKLKGGSRFGDAVWGNRDASVLAAEKVSAV